VSVALGRDVLRSGHQPKAAKSLGLSSPTRFMSARHTRGLKGAKAQVKLNELVQ
jgi:hypothetical protein